MKEINGREFKKLTLEMLVEFHRVCEENDLRYCLGYGTLLGAVRHQGFIPWDDDIDVSMPRKDYEKLYELSENNEKIFGENYRLASARNKYNIQKPVFNLIDIRTVTLSPTRQKKFFYPVWLDIFPMDDIPDSKEKWEERLNACRMGMQKVYRDITIAGGRLKIIKLLAKKICGLSARGRLITIDKTASGENLCIEDAGIQAGMQCTCYVSPYGMRDISDYSYYDNVSLCRFEGKRFRIPVDYDKRLKQLYGNYMKLPPKEEQIGHVTAAYWKD